MLCSSNSLFEGITNAYFWLVKMEGAEFGNQHNLILFIHSGQVQAQLLTGFFPPWAGPVLVMKNSPLPPRIVIMRAQEPGDTMSLAQWQPGTVGQFPWEPINNFQILIVFHFHHKWYSPGWSPKPPVYTNLMIQMKGILSLGFHPNMFVKFSFWVSI